MTTTARTVQQRIGDWQLAFEAIRTEITPEPMRRFLGAFAATTDVAGLRSFQDLARMVAANDRAAALVAGMLTAQGVKPLPVDLDLDEGEGL